MGDDGGLEIAFLTGALIGGFAMFAIGGCVNEDMTRHQAVKAGVAEYYLDANNDKQFRWKEAKCPSGYTSAS